MYSDHSFVIFEEINTCKKKSQVTSAAHERIFPHMSMVVKVKLTKGALKPVNSFRIMPIKTRFYILLETHRL